MAKNISEIPYTEGVERALELSRGNQNEKQKIRGIMQDVYVREVSSKFDWEFMIASSGITTTAQYAQGTCSVNTGDTTVVFSSDNVLTSAFTGRKFRITGNDVVYSVTFLNTTALTINPSFQGQTNVTGGAYQIFQPYYPLAGDFDRFPKDGGMYKWSGGKTEVLPEMDSYKSYRLDYQSTPSLPENVRLAGTDTAGNTLVEFIPPPLDARNYGYDYIRKYAPMTETTAGTILSIAAGGMAVVGNTTTRFTEANTGDWFRIDVLGTGQDSQWYRIISIGNDSSLTLATIFANTAITSSANYTIARAPEMPAKMHPAILYGTLRAMTLDQTDPNAAFYQMKFAETLSDGKRLYVTRVYTKDIHHLGEDYMYRR